MRTQQESVTVVHHRARRDIGGTFAVLRIENTVARNGDVLRHSEAIVAHGYPCRRAAEAAAKVIGRMQEVAAR